MDTITNDGLRTVALENIQLSDTGSQAERRKHFDKAAIAELAESIKSVGLLSPLIVRPVKVIESSALNGVRVGGKLLFAPDEIETAKATWVELVAGERRYLAAKLAGLKEVPVSVRALTDEQVLEVQLIENLQREGLHELAEAEGYEALQKLGHTADEIADKVGKSRAYVYGRLKLLALSKPARKAFYEGKLTASTALLIARIPVEAHQAQALKNITEAYGGQMSYRQAVDLVQREYMTRLGDAGFPTEDVDLVPAAGACGACHKRTGNQPQLFGDVKGTDVCTDLVCFRAKRDAHAAREIAKAKEKGAAVITGKRAEEVLPYGVTSVRAGFVALDDMPYGDPKNRTVKQLLGKDFVPTIVQDPKTGVLVKVAPQHEVNAALKAAGVRTLRESDPAQAAAEKKAKNESAFREALFANVRESYPKALERADWNDLALAILHEMPQETVKRLFKLWNWESKGKYGFHFEKDAAKLIPELSGPDLSKFLLDCIYVSELAVHTWSKATPEKLLAAAKRFNVNVAEVKRGLNAAAIPKAAKKKVARKGK